MLTHPHIEWVPGLFPGGKIVGTWRRYLPPSSVEVKEWVELYLYSPSGPSLSVIGWTLLYFIIRYFSLFNFLSFYILISLIKTILFRGKEDLFSLLEDKKSQRCDYCFHLTNSCLKSQHSHGNSTKKSAMYTTFICIAAVSIWRPWARCGSLHTFIHISM